MNAIERWNMWQKETNSLGETINLDNMEDTRGHSYADGPFPAMGDDGRPLGDHHEEPNPPPFGPYCITYECLWQNLGPHFQITQGGGDYVVGDVHEHWIGDQNGNGVLEWVVFYAYIPWMEDFIDNDGDGCVDERFNRSVNGEPICDSIPDGAVIYETGGSPQLGGQDGTLLVNLDWFSGNEYVELYRVDATPVWFAYRLRGMIHFPEIVGDFISYQAHEAISGVNSNPEMDKDFDDWYVGSIDARSFPGRRPIDRACSAGTMSHKDAVFKREDGWVVTSYHLVESFDGKDWNGDGDAQDYIVAYHAVDPTTGNCRQNVVNTGVYGFYPSNSGTIITPMYTSESADRRDWDGNGYNSGYRSLYHDINSTWSLKGRVYVSYTFTSQVPPWGFGWWGIFKVSVNYETHPFKYGGAYTVYVGASFGFYHAYFSVVSDEDGNRRTELPKHVINFGRVLGVVGGRCAVVEIFELYLAYANIWLMPTFQGDANGDGDSSDIGGYIFCPEEYGGGGTYVVEPNSPYAKGQYSYNLPVLWIGYVVYTGSHSINGTSTIIRYFHEDAVWGNVCTWINDPRGFCYLYYRVYV